MQALILKILTCLFTLPFLAGYRTYIIAAGLLGKAVYDVSVGDFPQAVTDFLGFLAAVGVRAALATGQVSAKAPVVALALFLAASGGFAAEPKTYDPYGYADYAAFFEHVKNGGYGALYVGVKDESVGSYRPHCRVESGFKGLADGVYDCTHTYGGWPQMTKRVAAVAGNPGSACPVLSAYACPGYACRGQNCPCGCQPQAAPVPQYQLQPPQLQRGLIYGNYGGCANGTCSGGR